MRALAILLLTASAAGAASLPALPGAMPLAMPSLLPNMPADMGIGARARLLPLVTAEALRLGVPPALADAVATIETGYTETSMGSSGEIGLMQVMPATAWMLGFRGNTNDLFDAATNIHYGVLYLSKAVAASGGNMCKALMKYRAGTGEEGFSPLSILYCRHAEKALIAQGSPLALQVAATTPAAPNLIDPYVIGGNGAQHFRPDWAAFAAVAGDDGVVVEKPVSAWHVSGTRGHVRVQAVMDVLRDDDGGAPHEVHISQSGVVGDE